MSSLLRSSRQFLAELRRRNVYQVAGAYLVAAFVVVQLAGLAADAFGLPGWFEPMVWTLCGLGFPTRRSPAPRRTTRMRSSLR